MRYCQNYRRIRPNFTLFSIIWYGWFQSFAVSKRENLLPWWSLRWSIPISIGSVWNASIDWAISTPSCSSSVWNSYFQNRRRNLPNFQLSSLIWHGWIQSSAVFKRQDVRWCSFRWSIPCSIGYVWNSYINEAISTSSCSYCIWNCYIKNYYW